MRFLSCKILSTCGGCSSYQFLTNSKVRVAMLCLNDLSIFPQVLPEPLLHSKFKQGWPKFTNSLQVCSLQCHCFVWVRYSCFLTKCMVVSNFLGTGKGFNTPSLWNGSLGSSFPSQVTKLCLAPTLFGYRAKWLALAYENL